MNARYLLGVALLVGGAVAACGGGATNALDDYGGTAPQDEGEGAGNGSNKPGGSTKPDTETPGVPGGTPGQTSAPGAQKFYVDNVHPTLSSGCGGCHGATGPGPNIMTAADAIKSHAQLLAAGYAIPQSAMVKKVAHGGSTTNFLKPAEVAKYEEWVALEAKEREAKGQPPPVNVLEKIGTCFDRAKFDALQMGGWQTTRRQANNNTNQVTPWNENGDNCTGCNNGLCRTCHTADAVSHYVNAVGNPIFPAEYTFEQTKTKDFVTQYFGVSPEGKPIASEGLKRKATATSKDVAYSHPYFTIPAAREAAIKAFTDDAIAKYNAGTCGK
jgi:hypothetical protein